MWALLRRNVNVLAPPYCRSRARLNWPFFAPCRRVVLALVRNTCLAHFAPTGVLAGNIRATRECHLQALAAFDVPFRHCITNSAPSSVLSRPHAHRGLGNTLAAPPARGFALPECFPAEPLSAQPLHTGAPCMSVVSVVRHAHTEQTITTVGSTSLCRVLALISVPTASTTTTPFRHPQVAQVPAFMLKASSIVTDTPHRFFTGFDAPSTLACNAVQVRHTATGTDPIPLRWRTAARCVSATSGESFVTHSTL